MRHILCPSRLRFDARAIPHLACAAGDRIHAIPFLAARSHSYLFYELTAQALEVPEINKG
jgi:hypothetical protein